MRSQEVRTEYNMQFQQKQIIINNKYGDKNNSWGMVVTGVSPSRKAKRLAKKSSRDSDNDDASTSEINKKKRKHTECVKNAKYYCFKQMKDVHKTCCNQCYKRK